MAGEFLLLLKTLSKNDIMNRIESELKIKTKKIYAQSIKELKKILVR
jgi:hypothetical protein